MGHSPNSLAKAALPFKPTTDGQAQRGRPGVEFPGLCFVGQTGRSQRTHTSLKDLQWPVQSTKCLQGEAKSRTLFSQREHHEETPQQGSEACKCSQNSGPKVAETWGSCGYSPAAKAAGQAVTERWIPPRAVNNHGISPYPDSSPAAYPSSHPPS